MCSSQLSLFYARINTNCWCNHIMFSAGPFFGTRRKPAQSSYPSATKVKIHTRFLLYWKIEKCLVLQLYFFPSGCIFNPPAHHLHIPATTSSAQPIRVHHQETKGWCQDMVPIHKISVSHSGISDLLNLICMINDMIFLFALPPGGPFQHTPDLYQSSSGSPPPPTLPCMTMASQQPPQQPPGPTHAAVTLAQQQQPVTIQVQEVELGGGAQRQSFLATPCHRVLGKQLSADNAETHRCWCWSRTSVLGLGFWDFIFMIDSKFLFSILYSFVCPLSGFILFWFVFSILTFLF